VVVAKTMKFQKIDSAGNHERFVLHIGREETKILVGLLRNARTNTPKLTETTSLIGRLRQMEREFRECLDANPPNEKAER
jgi:hypothetical protein